MKKIIAIQLEYKLVEISQKVEQKDDISDLMSEKNKDNFQIYETYVAIKAEHEY